MWIMLTSSAQDSRHVVRPSCVQELLQYWREKYNWRHHEALLNSFPQYTLPVNGQTIHFIHAPSSNPDAVPLLLMHGWPGSFYEFLKLLPLLQEAGDFHVVVPSLPGEQHA